MKIEPVLAERTPEAIEESIKRKRDGSIKLVLMVACLLLALACFLNADGAYYYNVSFDEKDKSLAVGQEFILKGYVSYAGEPVREYPCIISFTDILDNKTMYSSREYTDELGQLHYSRIIDDAFRYNGNYTYSVSCSNATETGTVFIQTGTYPSWFMNYLVYSNSRADWLVIGGAFIISALFVAWAWSHAILGDNE